MAEHEDQQRVWDFRFFRLIQSMGLRQGIQPEEVFPSLAAVAGDDTEEDLESSVLAIKAALTQAAGPRA